MDERFADLHKRQGILGHGQNLDISDIHTECWQDTDKRRAISANETGSDKARVLLRQTGSD